MTTFKILVAAAALGLTVSACGVSSEDRALSGAGIGAAAGAGGAALTGGDALTGAVLGGAAGAALGGFTDPDDFYLGRPLWDR